MANTRNQQGNQEENPLTRADIVGLEGRIREIQRQAEEAAQRRTASVDPRTYGEQYGSMVSQPAALERIQEVRPEEIADLVRRRREGAEGLTAPQYAVAREQMMSQQGAAEQQAQRQLARQQAIAGIRGGAATKQSSRLAQQLAQQRAQQEQGLFMADVGEKQKGLSAYEQTVGSAVQGEQARRLFNIEQQQREQLARQARELTVAQLSQAQALGERQAQAAEYYAQQMSKAPAGGGGGGTIICTELYRQGLMPADIYEADQKFGKHMLRHNPAVMHGYWVLAKPIVIGMQASKTFAKLVNFFAAPWAQEMAFRVTRSGKTSFAGRVIMAFGVPFCGFIGRIVRKGYGESRA